MKRILPILFAFTMFSCKNLKGQEVGTHPKSHYKHYNSIDTLIDGKFLRISIFYDDTVAVGTEGSVYKKAFWGNKDNSFETELSDGTGYFHETLKSTTENCFVLIDGCGTNCMYGIIFDTKTGEIFRTHVDFYPQNYPNDNNELILYGDYNNEVPALVILNVENRRKDTLTLTKDWSRGVNFISSFFDEIQVENNKICVVQLAENEGEAARILKKEICLKK